MSVSGGDLGEWVGPEQRPDPNWGQTPIEILRRELRAIAHELLRRRAPQDRPPWVLHLPQPDPYLTPLVFKRGGKVVLAANNMTTVTELDDQERWDLIAWLIAQDVQEESPTTT